MNGQKYSRLIAVGAAGQCLTEMSQLKCLREGLGEFVTDRKHSASAQRDNWSKRLQRCNNNSVLRWAKCSTLFENSPYKVFISTKWRSFDRGQPSDTFTLQITVTHSQNVQLNESHYLLSTKLDIYSMIRDDIICCIIKVGFVSCRPNYPLKCLPWNHQRSTS